jgi:Trk K+ transport system NAD-binding subunit
MRLEVPRHLIGKPVRSLNVEGKILVAGVDRGGHGFIPVGSSAFQEGDVVHVILDQDAVDLLDELLAPGSEH